MSVVTYQIPDGQMVPASRGSSQKVWKEAARVFLFSCEGCGKPAGFGDGVSLRAAMATGDVEKAGRWFCGFDEAGPYCRTRGRGPIAGPGGGQPAERHPPVAQLPDLFGVQADTPVQP